jgi:hypothetical protein
MQQLMPALEKLPGIWTGSRERQSRLVNAAVVLLVDPFRYF